MTFKEYRENGWFLQDVRENSQQSITVGWLQTSRRDPYYVDLRQNPTFQTEIPGVDERERMILFSITVYFTSLLLQSVGKLYRHDVFEACCLACHWPFFRIDHGCVVDSPIDVLRYGGLKPFPQEVEAYMTRLEEATSYFVEYFLSFPLPYVVDPPVLRKELENELKVLKKWLRDEDVEYSCNFMNLAHLVYPFANNFDFKKSSKIAYPEGLFFMVQACVTLHSEHYREQLQTLSFTVSELNFKEFRSVPQGAELLNIIRNVLSGETVTIDYNMVTIKTPLGMIADETAALELLREPIVNATYCTQSGLSANGDISYKVKGDSLRIEILRGKDEDLYDVICVRFDTVICVHTPVALVPLDQLLMPYEVDFGEARSWVVGIRILLEYGNKVSLEECNLRDCPFYIIKVPESPEEMERIFFHEYIKKCEFMRPDIWHYCTELLEEIRMDPLSYVDNMSPLIRKYALLLVG